jgi:hypothetical protein
MSVPYKKLGLGKSAKPEQLIQRMNEIKSGNMKAYPNRPKKTKKMPKLGSGKRFANLKSELGHKGAKNPGALAAFIGRKKYGAKKFASLSKKDKK